MKPVQKIRDYTLEEIIGEGGMGTVWRARHNMLNRPMAIKVMTTAIQNDPGFEQRFLQEAQAQARLKHECIVSVVDFFGEFGNYYLVMPLVDGPSLEQRLKQNGPLPPDKAVAISRDVLGALNYAHQQGIIHRDVKPSNILFDRDDKTYLVDFGIALMIGQERKTRTGTTIGTPYYMSPEQIRRPKSLDHRTDVYSFGCVLYEMLTGHTVFEVGVDEEGDTDFIIKDGHLNREPRPLRQLNSNIPPAIEAIVLRALAKSPDARFSGCGEFARALAEAVQPIHEPSLVEVTCQNCTAKNSVTREHLARAFCTHCGKQLVVAKEEKIQVANANGKWKPAGIMLGIATLVCLIGWFATCDSLNTAKSRIDSLESRVSGLSTAESDKKKLQDQLAAEVDTRKRLAKLWPVTVTGIALRPGSLADIQGDVGTIFPETSTFHIHYRISLQNNYVGIQDTAGTIGLYVYDPTGHLIKGPDSPANSTQNIQFSITDSTAINGEFGPAGLTTVGPYRMEFWYQGDEIGVKEFRLN